MRLVDLDPVFLKLGDQSWSECDFAQADGVMFLCPKCFVANGGPVGTHQVLCWRPNVPLDQSPGPGRWQFRGSGASDLSLDAEPRTSIELTSGCRAHFFVKEGEVTFA